VTAASRAGRIIATLAALLTSAGCATADYGALMWSGGEPSTLEAWFDDELEPYLAETLTTHPRFRRETITVAVMHGEEPQPAPDALSRALTLRLTRFLQSTPGVNLIWEGGRSAGDCIRREDAHYLLAVDLQQSGPASHRLAVRALDREEGLWVTGFGREWNGRLTRGQYARFRQPAATAQSRGLRDDPFREDEGDLLAERLATELAADFCGFVGEPLVVHADTAGQPAFVADVVQLVANNLARSPSIRTVTDAAGANLVLSGRLYAIDNDLQQFWVQARPTADQVRFPVADVAAYVETTAAATRLARRPPAQANQPAVAQLLTDLSGSENPRVLFLIYEALFVALLMGFFRYYLPTSTKAHRWVRRVTGFVLLYYGLWAAADAIILATRADTGFLLRVVPNVFYYGGLAPLIVWTAPQTDPT